MAEKVNAANRLGTEPVGKLLLQFSIPAITGMLVNALYNVVDRIWVGRGVNELALGGLSLVMPLMTITMAFSMLFGIGSANLISMRLGQRRKEDAENALNHCFFLLVISALIIFSVEMILLDQILARLGSEVGSATLDYARRYYKIILYGQVFFMLGFGFSHCTRAQGFPLITMIGMILGAGMNIILDPLFIIVLGWGVEGAALATVISQLLSAVWILYFVNSKKAVVRLNLCNFRFSFSIVLDIMTFGCSQFLLQFAMSTVQFLINMSLGWYGAATLGEGGGDIALSGLNITMSISMLFFMPVFGINQGAQPILGFNYGAKKFDRVRKTFILAITGATSICLFGFILAQTLSGFLVRVFTPDGSDTLLSFAPDALRVIMIAMPLNGFTIVATNFFVVTGRPKISIFLSMLRQVIALIPCLLIFGRMWGLWGVVAAPPVSDSFAFVTTGFMIILEMRKLKADHLGNMENHLPSGQVWHHDTETNMP